MFVKTTYAAAFCIFVTGALAQSLGLFHLQVNSNYSGVNDKYIASRPRDMGFESRLVSNAGLALTFILNDTDSQLYPQGQTHLRIAGRSTGRNVPRIYFATPRVYNDPGFELLTCRAAKSTTVVGGTQLNCTGPLKVTDNYACTHRTFGPGGATDANGWFQGPITNTEKCGPITLQVVAAA